MEAGIFLVYQECLYPEMLFKDLLIIDRKRIIRRFYKKNLIHRTFNKPYPPPPLLQERGLGGEVLYLLLTSFIVFITSLLSPVSLIVAV